MASSACLQTWVTDVRSVSANASNLSTPLQGSERPYCSPVSSVLKKSSFFGSATSSFSARMPVEQRRSHRAPLRSGAATCGLWDFFNVDLIRFDVGKFLDQVQRDGALATYSPPEGGYEGPYATALKNDGYEIMNMSARGLGDPEAYLTKVHGVRPPHLGKQAVARFYLPPEIDYRLQFLAPNCKGLVVWVIECQVLSKTELQFLALLPILRPNVKVIAEMGSAREFKFKPLKDLVGLPKPPVAAAPATEGLKPFPVPIPQQEKEREAVPVAVSATQE